MCVQENVEEEVRRQLKEIESELSFQELVILRNLVMNRIKKKRDLAEVSDQTLLRVALPQ